MQSHFLDYRRKRSQLSDTDGTEKRPQRAETGVARVHQLERRQAYLSSVVMCSSKLIQYQELGARKGVSDFKEIAAYNLTPLGVAT